MSVEFKTKKLKRQCENPKVAQKDFNLHMKDKLTRRIGELVAATNLQDIKNIPATRLHRLKGDRSGEYAVDLIHPKRLIFTPLEIDIRDMDKLHKITAVRIESVEDYHGKQRR